MLDATGALQIDGHGPEKNLQALQAEPLLASLQVNAVGPALLLRHLSPLLARGERVIWGKLSARVGSIEDNHKGGWYGYRAAKAALNQLLQTAAIELARQRPLAVVAALQPGTVRSALSAPFVGEAASEPALAAQGLLQALDAAPATGRALFLDHRGEPIAWGKPCLGLARPEHGAGGLQQIRRPQRTGEASARAMCSRRTVGLGQAPRGSSNHWRTSCSSPTPCMKL